MATRTMTVKSGGRPALGWHEVTIKKATFDTNDNGSTYIDVWFNELPETLNMRVYEAFDKQGNEFAVGSVFRFANAGITTVLDGPNGEKSVTIDDNPNGLRDHKLSVYLYADPKNPKYSRILDRIAPVVQEGEHLSFTATDVDSIKRSADKSLANKLAAMPSPNGAVTSEPFANQF